MLLAQPLIVFLLTPAYVGMNYVLRLVLPFAVGNGWNIFQS